VRVFLSLCHSVCLDSTAVITHPTADEQVATGYFDVANLYENSVMKLNFHINNTRTINLPEGQCTSVRVINSESGFVETVFVQWPSEAPLCEFRRLFTATRLAYFISSMFVRVI
jgi:hypothetical protein